MRGYGHGFEPALRGRSILGMDVNGCGDVHADFCNIEIANLTSSLRRQARQHILQVGIAGHACSKWLLRS